MTFCIISILKPVRSVKAQGCWTASCLSGTPKGTEKRSGKEYEYKVLQRKDSPATSQGALSICHKQKSGGLGVRPPAHPTKAQFMFPKLCCPKNAKTWRLFPAASAAHLVWSAFD